MKKIVCCLWFVVCGFICFSQHDTLIFSQLEINFGVINGVSTPKKTVWVYNKGKNVVAVSGIVWGSDFCPCLYKNNAVIVPGDSLAVTIFCTNFGSTTAFSRTASIKTSIGMYRINYKGEFILPEKAITPPPPKKK